jgi:hypothetical protein
MGVQRDFECMESQSSFACVEENSFSLCGLILFSFFIVCPFRGFGSPEEFPVFLCYYLHGLIVVVILFVKFYVSSVFFECNSLVGMYVVSNLPNQKSLNLIILLIWLIILLAKTVALVFHLRVS